VVEPVPAAVLGKKYLGKNNYVWFAGSWPFAEQLQPARTQRSSMPKLKTLSTLI
jgi:hypothetical protein